MTQERKNKVIAGTATAVFFISLIALVWLYQSRSTVKNALNDTRLEAEHLLSEKLTLDKEIQSLKGMIEAMKGKNMELDKILAQTSEKLSKRENEIQHIQWDKAKSARLEKEMTEIKKIRSDLDRKVVELSSSLAQIKGDNADLRNQLASLQSANEGLMADNNVLKSIVANNFLIEATRGNSDKLTVVAKKTKKLTVGFDMATDVVQNINFRIKTPNGQILSREEDGISMTELTDHGNLLASSSTRGEFEVTKRIEMTYRPKARLNKGIYKIDIYNKDSYIGSCQIKLR